MKILGGNSKKNRIDILSKEAETAGKDMHILVQDFLDAGDIQAGYNPKNAQEYDVWNFFNQNLRVEIPSLTNYWRFGNALPLLKRSDHFFTVRASLYPRLYDSNGSGAHYYELIVETEEHLHKRASLLERAGDIAALYEIDKILLKYKKNGLASLPSLHPPTATELDVITREALESFALLYPAKFAKLFNEESVKLGFFHHVKRHDALEALEESLK